MSTDTSSADRLARGELPVSEPCEYCGAAPDKITRTQTTENVAQHSHHGTRHTVTKCDECDGRFAVTAHVQSRVNRPSRPTETAVRWDIPEDYCKPVCTECGATGEAMKLCEENMDAFRTILDPEGHCPRCGGVCEFMEESLTREPPEPGENTGVRGE